MCAPEKQCTQRAAMEEEGSINFQALRAKFQEEALLAQSRTSRPAVAEKPKHLPPPGGHCGSVVSSFNTALESKTQLVPPVLSRDGLRASGGRRPISFPPQPLKTPPPLLSGGESTKRHSLRDRHMPLVLPVLPVKDQTSELPAKKEPKLEPEPEKEVLPQTKIKKKGLLLPFKSAKSLKVSEENGEEPTHPDPTTRPRGSPCELPSVEKQTAEDGVSLQSDQSTADCPLSSPDVTVTPPPAETTTDADSRIMSTLEKAKKKFSCRQMLISTRPKSLRSPDSTSRDRELPSPPKNADSSWADLPVPPPVSLPHLACISARPFFKASTSARKPVLEKPPGRAKAEHPLLRTAEPHPPCPLLKKQLPDLGTLGPPPAKPTRPPVVDFSCYHAASVSKVSPCFSQISSEEPESEHPSTPDPPLDVLQFPDIEMETAESEAVDIAALELEAVDLISADIHAPVNFEVTNSERPHVDLSACYPAEASGSSVVQDLNLGSPNIIPLHPGSFPEPINLSELLEPAVPERRSQSEEALVDSFPKSHSDETDLPAAECQCVPGESELRSHAAWSDGIQTHSSSFQQDHYYEAYDNVYEDVENIKKFMEKKSSKQQGSVKNPYAGNHTMEEPCGNKWPRNPWGSATGEHAHLTHNHVLSKEPQSPNAADFKEYKKREKQRLEKEKKEQKEREKKENEMRKKFKVTGDEEPMYHARVMVASKVRKHDLPVKTGDMVSIIRTTNCPKGKWLARDANHKYGYISLMNVELNIKEMLELGKKAQAAGRGGNAEGDNISIGSRSSSHLVLTSSFTDDSEEWACEDETISPSSEIHCFAAQTASVLETSCVHVGAQHTLSDANLEDLHTQTRHEALQKLAIFFQHNRNEFSDVPEDEGATPTNDEPSSFLHAVEEPPYPEQEVDFTDLEFLPPPPLYADNT